MVEIEVTANREIQVIPEGVPLVELAIISNNNSRALTHEELKVRAVQKKKDFQPYLSQDNVGKIPYLIR